MEKKTYSKPQMAAQRFEPQEFISACPPSETFVTYEFWCDARVTSYGANRRYHVYFDNGDGVFNTSGYNADRSAMPSNWSYSPCMQTHSVTVPKGQSIDDVFPKGWLVPLTGYGTEQTDQAVAVRIWQPNSTDYANTHCTRQLSEDEFTIKNPS